MLRSAVLSSALKGICGIIGSDRVLGVWHCVWYESTGSREPSCLQEAPIAGLARATLEHWRKVWAHHMDVLLDPAYLADPRAEAKALLKAITEHVGAEKCRREPKTPALSMRPQVGPNDFVSAFSDFGLVFHPVLAVGDMLPWSL